MAPPPRPFFPLPLVFSSPPTPGGEPAAVSMRGVGGVKAAGEAGLPVGGTSGRRGERSHGVPRGQRQLFGHHGGGSSLPDGRRDFPHAQPGRRGVRAAAHRAGARPRGGGASGGFGGAPPGPLPLPAPPAAPPPARRPLRGGGGAGAAGGHDGTAGAGAVQRPAPRHHRRPHWLPEPGGAAGPRPPHHHRPIGAQLPAGAQPGGGGAGGGGACGGSAHPGHPARRPLPRAAALAAALPPRDPPGRAGGRPQTLPAVPPCPPGPGAAPQETRQEAQEEEGPERAAEAGVGLRPVLPRHPGRHQGPEPQRHLRGSVQDRGLHVGQSGRGAEAGVQAQDGGGQAGIPAGARGLSRRADLGGASGPRPRPSPRLPGPPPAAPSPHHQNPHFQADSVPVPHRLVPRRGGDGDSRHRGDGAGGWGGAPNRHPLPPAAPPAAANAAPPPAAPRPGHRPAAAPPAAGHADPPPRPRRAPQNPPAPPAPPAHQDPAPSPPANPAPAPGGGAGGAGGRGDPPRDAPKRRRRRRARGHGGGGRGARGGVAPPHGGGVGGVPAAAPLRPPGLRQRAGRQRRLGRGILQQRVPRQALQGRFPGLAGGAQRRGVRQIKRFFLLNRAVWGRFSTF